MEDLRYNSLQFCSTRFYSLSLTYVRHYAINKKAFWFVFFFWKGRAINNCYMYKFLHLNYKFTSVKSINIVFVLNCRQRIGTYVEEIDKLYTIAL